MNESMENGFAQSSACQRLVKFEEVPRGAFFEFRGQRYRKLALNMSESKDRVGTVFHHECVVAVDAGVHLLPRRGEQPEGRNPPILRKR
jgi:hypothetical protein